MIKKYGARYMTFCSRFGGYIRGRLYTRLYSKQGSRREKLNFTLQRFQLTRKLGLRFLTKIRFQSTDDREILYGLSVRARGSCPLPWDVVLELDGLPACWGAHHIAPVGPEAAGRRGIISCMATHTGRVGNRRPGCRRSLSGSTVIVILKQDAL